MVISVAALIVLPILGVLLMFLAWGMEMEGVWPFKRLGSYHRAISLENGGSLLLDGKEFRSFGEQGFTERASYRPPGSNSAEPFGSWDASQVEPKIYFSGPLVVVLSPDSTTVYVRTHVVLAVASEEETEPQGSNVLRSVRIPTVNENWKRFSMHFPDELTSLPLSFYSERAGIPEDDLRRIHKDLDAEERKWDPSAYTKSFEPKTRELIVTFYVGMAVTRYLRMKLSEDGTGLTLLEIERRNRTSPP